MSTHSILQKISPFETDAVDSNGVHAATFDAMLADTMRANDNVAPLSARMLSHAPVQFALKRAMDVGGALAGLLVLAPILLLIAALIRIESRGPVFFRQLRTGRNEVPFEILKFRSMYVEQCDHAGLRLTVDGDPRVTRMGRFLRKTSLDEIPQLWNVVIGHMSLVGPRPHVPDMVAGGMNYADLVRGYENRHLVRPGLTGLAQSRGLRGPTTDPDTAIRRIASDVEYIRTFSILLDIRILARTILNELRGGTGS